MALVIATACAAGPQEDATPPPDTGPSDNLAPSQLTAETVLPPETPPPCELDAIALWTAQVRPSDGSAVVRVRNDGDRWCEVDVRNSPLVDPMMEPDVWLEPGEWADLVVGATSDDCADRAVVRLAQLDVNGATAVVETAAVVTCGWHFSAFYPVAVPDEPCTELAVAVVEDAILLRNDALQGCALGELRSVGGDDVAITAAEIAPDDRTLGVPLLASGDVVALPVSSGGGSCSTRVVELGFESGTVLELSVDGCSVTLGLGAPQPWIGGPGDPTSSTGDAAALLAALDPFDA